MRPYKSYSGDPRWITTKRAGQALDGSHVPAGSRVFYYPRTGAILTGQKAEQAAAEFASAAADEAFESGCY